MIVVSRGRPCHVPTVPLVTLYSSLDFPATIAMSYRARSHLNVALSIRPVTGILSTDWNQRIALSVSGPIVPSTGP
jgi:hypothetical protein